MSGDWIKMRADLLTHPKIVRMASALKADKLRVIGALHTVWCLFDMHSADGQLEGYTPTVLDNHLGWAGFSVQMMAVKWLEHTADSLAVPRFDEHNGQSAKRRATETERKRAARESEAKTPSASDADKKRSREEKRREEKKEDKEPAAQAFVLPDWIPAETWAAYCKVRTGKKAKNEPHALGLIVKDLEKFRQAGHDPVDCLNNSIKSGWAGVFEPKTLGTFAQVKADVAKSTVSLNPDVEATRRRIEADAAIPRNGPTLAVLERMAELRGHRQAA